MLYNSTTIKWKKSISINSSVNPVCLFVESKSINIHKQWSYCFFCLINVAVLNQWADGVPGESALPACSSHSNVTYCHGLEQGEKSRTVTDTSDTVNKSPHDFDLWPALFISETPNAHIKLKLNNKKEKDCVTVLRNCRVF